jgi:hypothetical protein
MARFHATARGNIPFTPEEEAQADADAAEWEAASDARRIEQARAQRLEAYRLEADPLFFKFQREEISQQEWLDKIIEIKNRYPK